MDQKRSLSIMSQRSISSSKSDTASDDTTSASVSPALIEEELTAIDLECVIQKQRIAKLLEDAIYKTKLLLCLPTLMRERRTLASVLHRQDLQEVSFIFEQYVNPLLCGGTNNVNALENLQSGNMSLKFRLNPELGHLLYTLNKYKVLGPSVEAMIRDVINLTRRPKATDEQTAPGGFDYLAFLELFYKQMTTRCETKAADEVRALIEIRDLEKSNEKLIVEIKELEDAIKNENEAFELELQGKKDLIKRNEFKLSKIQQNAAAVLKGNVRDCDRQMVLHTRSHKVRYEMLMEEEKEFREMYRLMLNKDILEEATHRHRRTKLETQLLSWRQKYDLDMSEKQAQLEELCDLCDEEDAKVKKLELKLEEQNVEYVKLMKEKDDEYQKELTEKMNLFMLTHAARVLQMAWRETLAKRSEEKKLRKMLKKQQRAAGAAARAAAIQEKKKAAAAKKAAAVAKKLVLEELKATLKAEKAALAAEKAEKSKQVKIVKKKAMSSKTIS